MPVVLAHTGLGPVIDEVVAVLIVTERLTGVPTQPAALVSVTCTLPAPAAPQSTVMLFVFAPLACVPPVITHAYVLPAVLATL